MWSEGMTDEFEIAARRVTGSEAEDPGLGPSAAESAQPEPPAPVVPTEVVAAAKQLAAEITAELPEGLEAVFDLETPVLGAEPALTGAGDTGEQGLQPRESAPALSRQARPDPKVRAPARSSAKGKGKRKSTTHVDPVLGVRVGKRRCSADAAWGTRCKLCGEVHR